MNAFSPAMTNISIKDVSVFAQKTIENKMGVCVKMIPHVQSFYFWDGEILQASKLNSSYLKWVRDYVEKN